MRNEIIIVNTDGCERPSSHMDYEMVKDVLYEKSKCEEISIIVQAYGRVDKTRLCVDHILRFTQDIPFRLILLDNGSEEKAVMDYFESVEYADKTIIRMTKNITAVYGLDKVMHMVDTKYVVIVNNDVLVTPSWLHNLLKCANSDPKIGMVCPVSTNVGCGQEIDLGGFGTINEMIKKAEHYNISDPAKWEERLRMIPTVVLYRREIFEVVGVYDTGYIHDWGDDDYSFRIRHAGYRLMLCKDTFVHHNHNIRAHEEKDPKDAYNLYKMGRTTFQKRHYGIDSWDDTNDTIASVLRKVDINHHYDGYVESLSIDCKCGAMILDVRNFYRRKEIYDIHTTALVKDIKYYHELQCVADRVIWGDLREIEEKPIYDFITIGKPINQYVNPMEILEKVYRMLTENGLVLFGLINSADYRQFLYCLGITDVRDKEMSRCIYKELPV